jgi:hypothetical protein
MLRWRALYAQGITIGSTDRGGNQKLSVLVVIAATRQVGEFPFGYGQFHHYIVRMARYSLMALAIKIIKKHKNHAVEIMA